MRMAVLFLLVVLAGSAPSLATPVDLPGTGDLADLERRWHTCVREAFAEEPTEHGRAAAQRNALDACKTHEDAYVAALLVARAEAARSERSLTARARVWALSLASSVLDPVSSWITILKR